MNWLSYLNGSLYISVELSGFTGTETRGQLIFLLYDETPTLSTINVLVLIIGASDIATIPAASIRRHYSGSPV